MSAAPILRGAARRYVAPGSLRMATRSRTANAGVLASQLPRGYATASGALAEPRLQQPRVGSILSAPSTGSGQTIARQQGLLHTTAPAAITDAKATKVEAPTISPRVPEQIRNAKQVEDWVLYHPVYGPEEVKSIQVTRHPDKTLSDKAATALIRLFRFGFDLVSGYRHSTPEDAKRLAASLGKETLTLEDMRKANLVMDTKQWLIRILFLESIAGVPGMVAATLRHLRSLRGMKRDGGFIHQLLEEAENERMHLLTFMKISQPSLFFRFLILGAQGVFYNLFFLSYLISPKICHRFVGKLEEEAVWTYTNCIHELETGKLPEWENMPAPDIAKEYWRLPENSTLKDVIYAVRADEAGHRFTNHTFANVADTDFNPFAIKKPDGKTQGTSPGFSREEGLKWYEAAVKELRAGRERSPNQ